MSDSRMSALGRALAEALTHYSKERDMLSQKAVADLHHDLCVELQCERAGQNVALDQSHQAALYKRGDPVVKIGGDYIFEGSVAFLGTKLGSGELRYAVEDDRGLLLIVSEKQLQAGHLEKVALDPPKSPVGAQQTEKVNGTA